MITPLRGSLATEPNHTLLLHESTPQQSDIMGEKGSWFNRLSHKKTKDGRGAPAEPPSTQTSPSPIVPTGAKSSASLIAVPASEDAGHQPPGYQPAAIKNPVTKSAVDPVVSDVHTENSANAIVITETSSQQPAELLTPPQVSLWDEAYDALKASNGELIKAYEGLLSSASLKESISDISEVENLVPQHDTAARRKMMCDITALSLQHVEDKKISKTVLGHEITIEKAIANTAAAVTWAEDYIKDAAKDLPYASIVIVGVSLLLPLLKNPVAAEEARSSGFTYVTSQMRYYDAMESLLVPQDMDPELRAELAGQLSQLYGCIIEFQVRSIIHVYRSRTKCFFRGTINYDNWNGLLASLKESEKELEGKFSKVQSAQILDTLKQTRRDAEASRRKLDTTLDELVQLLRHQLGITKRMAKRIEDDADRACVELLDADDPRDDKARIESDKGGLLEDSYRWIFANESFQRWRTQSQGFLWIRGDPGKGKTMLVCAVADEIVKSAYTSNVGYFFCQATNDRINSGAAVLRGLIYMLLKQQPSLMSHLRVLCDGIGSKRFEGRNAWVALSTLFRNMAKDTQIGETYLLIDALDECVTDLKLLLELISDLSSQPNIKWLLSSRNVPEIAAHLEKTKNNCQLSLELNAASVSAAVNAYIDHKVTELESSKDYDEDVRRTVEEYLVQNSNATFLWVALVCQQLTTFESWEVVDEIKKGIFPSDLNELYEQMLARVINAPPTRSDACRRILVVICTVYRPITLHELPCLADLPKALTNNLKELKKMVGLCGSFLTLKQSIITIVHQSAADFLRKQAAAEVFRAGIQQAHYSIFLQSLDSLFVTLRRDMYNLSHPFCKAMDIQQPDPDPLAAVKYSTVYWVDHLEEAMSVCDRRETEAKIDKFIRTKYLYWLEALGLIGRVPKGIQALTKLQQLMALSTEAEFQDSLRDASRFLRYFKVAIELAPLQVYASGLVFSPTRSLTRRNFNSDMFKVITITTALETDWDDCVQTLEGHDDRVDVVAFSPDSQLIVSGSSDATVRIWDTTSGTCVHTLNGHKQPIHSVAFSLDGETVASGSYNAIKIWNVITGQCIKALDSDEDSITSLVYLPDGHIAYGAFRGLVHIWNPATGQLLRELTGHDNLITSIMGSKGGQTIASGSHDATVRLWDASTGKCTQVLQGHDHWVHSIALSSDGKKIASGSHDKTMKIWDTQTGTCMHTLNGHDDVVNAVAFSPNSEVVASSSHDMTLRIWSTTTGKCMQTLQSHGELISSIAFSPDGEKIASGSHDMTVRVWDTKTGVCIQTLEGHNSAISCVIFSPDGKTIVTSSDDDTIRIWDASTITNTQHLHIQRHPVTLVKLSPDGRTLLSSSLDGTLRLWDSTNGRLKHTIPLQADFARHATFSMDGNIIVVYLNDKTIWIWDASRLAWVQTLRRSGVAVASIALSPDGKTIACGTYGGVAGGIIEIWDTTTGTLLRKISGRQELSDVVFSPDSKTVVSSADHYTIRVWDAVSGVPGISCEASRTQSELCISPDGTRIASGHYGGMVHVWDASNGDCIHRLEGPDSHISLVTFSPDGSTILSQSNDGVVRIWDAVTGTCTQILDDDRSWAMSANLLLEVHPQSFSPMCYNEMNASEWIMVHQAPFIWIPPDYRTGEVARGAMTIGLGL